MAKPQPAVPLADLVDQTPPPPKPTPLLWRPFVVFRRFVRRRVTNWRFRRHLAAKRRAGLFIHGEAVERTYWALSQNRHARTRMAATIAQMAAAAEQDTAGEPGRYYLVEDD